MFHVIEALDVAFNLAGEGRVWLAGWLAYYLSALGDCCSSRERESIININSHELTKVGNYSKSNESCLI